VNSNQIVQKGNWSLDSNCCCLCVCGFPALL